MKIKPFTCFLFAVAIILVAISPWLIQSHYYEEPESVPYKGILTIWNITDWRTGGSSCMSFLKKRIEEFEDHNPYIFIDIIDITKSEAEQEIKNNEIPDMISYPLGFKVNFPLYELPQKKVSFPQISDYSYPYMCGGYCILINSDMLDQEGIFAPISWGISPEELISISKLGVCFDSENGYSSLPAIATHEFPYTVGPKISTWGESALPEAVLNLPIVSYTDGLDYFCSNKAGVLIASQRQLFEINQLNNDGKAPSFLSYAISGYTDMVQMVGVSYCEDEKKLEACSKFAEYLISDSVQSKLEALGTFPVIDGLDIYEDNSCLYSIYELHKNAKLGTAENRQILSELTIQAINGDEQALKKLRNILGAYG